jgi:D-alanyl-D-alanine carboxypeptidase
VSELQQLLDRLVAAGAPGAAGWVRNERGSLGAASGLANRRTRQPMRPELRFRAGSMTKSLVAAVVLRLAAEGRLSLADPLERWLPGSLHYGDRVSLRQLLNHTGGVPHRTATLEQALYASRPGRLRAWTPQALVAMVADQPPVFPAGTAWSYSNTGYVLLGLVVEAASQRTLGQELGRSILGPLGLRDTLLPDSAPEIPGPSARGYSLPLGPHGEALDGPLLDFTVQNPSWAGAAGARVPGARQPASELSARSRWRRKTRAQRRCRPWAGVRSPSPHGGYRLRAAIGANREYWPWKVTVTVSVGPLRCLARIRSASPLRGDSAS